MEMFPMTDINDILRLANCNGEEELMEVSDSFDIEFDDQLVIETGIVGFTEDGVIVEGDEKILELLGHQGVLTESTDIKVEYRPDPGLAGDMQSLLGLLDESTQFIPRPSAKFTPKPLNIPDIQVRDKEDFWAKRKVLQKQLSDPQITKDPELLRKVQAEWEALNRKAPELEIVLPEDEMSEAMLMGNSNEPCEENMSEAEYQGRKVQLNKPMAGDVKKSKVYVKKPNGNVVKVNFGDKNMRIKKSNPARRKSFRARHHCDNPGPKWKARYWSCRAW